MLPSAVANIFNLPNLNTLSENRNLRSSHQSQHIFPQFCLTNAGENCLCIYLPKFINRCETVLIESVETKTLMSYKIFTKSLGNLKEIFVIVQQKL